MNVYDLLYNINFISRPSSSFLISEIRLQSKWLINLFLNYVPRSNNNFFDSIIKGTANQGKIST